MCAKDQQDGFREAIAAEPYDPSIRLIYHDWLLDQDDPKGAGRERWLARMLAGAVKYELVITRQGVLEQASKCVKRLRTQERDYWLKITGRMFEAELDVLFVIVDDRAKTKIHLRAERPCQGVYTSPVLFYRKNWKPWGGAKNRQVPRVLTTAGAGSKPRKRHIGTRPKSY
jgi:uncharacterized protein (TIGR02996 family)